MEVWIRQVFLTRPMVTLAIGTLMVLPGLFTVGCKKPDNRISMTEFVERQKRASDEMAQKAKDAAPIDLNSYLGPYKVGSGDELIVTLTRADQTALMPPVHGRVDRDGGFDLPIVGTIRVGGLELEDVEKKIRAAFVPNVVTDGVIFVELFNADPTNVLVVGAVPTPSMVQLRRTERNLLFAIVSAGGVSPLASGRVTLHRLRDPGQSHTFDLTEPLELREALAIKPLEHGDIVEVEAAAPNTVFVGGLVIRAGPQTYPDGTKVTILQVLAAAGGLRTDVTPTEGTLVRRMLDGQDVHVKFDLNRLAMGNDPNIELMPGDILWVPDTFNTRLQEFINQNIFLRAGVTVNYSVSGSEFINRRGRFNRFSGGGGGGGTLQDSADPFGFLNRNSSLQGLTARP